MKPTFKVTMVEEHPDGSATFTLDGTREAIQYMMESMVRQAIVDGIDKADEKTALFCLRENAIGAARYTIECLDRYMASGSRSDRLELQIARDKLSTILKSIPVAPHQKAG